MTSPFTESQRVLMPKLNRSIALPNEGIERLPGKEYSLYPYHIREIIETTTHGWPEIRYSVIGIYPIPDWAFEEGLNEFIELNRPSDFAMKPGVVTIGRRSHPSYLDIPPKVNVDIMPGVFSGHEFIDAKSVYPAVTRPLSLQARVSLISERDPSEPSRRRRYEEVSRLHAALILRYQTIVEDKNLQYKGTDFSLVDLNSTNGTTVADDKLSPREQRQIKFGVLDKDNLVTGGDLIRLAGIKLKLVSLPKQRFLQAKFGLVHLPD